MIAGERVLVVDIDGTLCEIKRSGQSYADVAPVPAVVDRLARYRREGFRVALYTSRNMRTYDGNIGEITAKTLPLLVQWLARHGVEYDELHVGKPWPGVGGFYVDDRTVRPDEFVSLSYEEILRLINTGDQE
jgi:capsule biosynthesis phosphatase